MTNRNATHAAIWLR